MSGGNLRNDTEPAELAELEQALLVRWPMAHWLQTRILVAVSGGADSMALLHALQRISRRAEPTNALIEVAHYNHGWRGAASDRDEAFVAAACQRLQLHFHAGRMPPVASDAPSKSEELARQARYDFLTSTAYTCGARYVVTGHTANDRVETVLLNLFRGTGLSGVAGPSLFRQLDRELVLVRPLVGCWREQITDYLTEIGETHIHDTSNDDTQYRRNYIRRELLPNIRREFGEPVDQRLYSFSELAEEAVTALREWSGEYLRLVEALRRDAGLVGDPEAAWVPSRALLDYPWVVVREGLTQLWQQRSWRLQGMTREKWLTIRELIQEPVAGAGQSTLNLPGGLIATREGGWIKFARG